MNQAQRTAWANKAKRDAAKPKPVLSEAFRERQRRIGQLLDEGKKWAEIERILEQEGLSR